MKVKIDAVDPDPILIDDNGSLSDWTRNDLSTTTSQSYEGSSSLRTTNGQNGQPQGYQTFSGGKQPSFFRYYYRELSSSSTGGGIRLYNSNNNLELGVATDNPEWDYRSGNGLTQTWYDPGSSGYAEWYEVMILIDWSSDTFDLRWTRLNTGYSQVLRDEPLVNGVDVKQLNIETYNGTTWQDGSQIDMWFDSLDLGSTAIELESTQRSPSQTLSDVYQIQDGTQTIPLTTFNDTSPIDYKFSFTKRGPYSPAINSFIKLVTLSGSINGTQNATIYVIDKTSGSIAAKTTSSSGSYSIDVFPGSYHVIAQASDGSDLYNAKSYSDVEVN